MPRFDDPAIRDSARAESDGDGEHAPNGDLVEVAIDHSFEEV